MFFAVNRYLVSIQSMFFLPSVPNYAPQVLGLELLGPQLPGGSGELGDGGDVLLLQDVFQMIPTVLDRI